MRIALLSTNDTRGGAARATWRLHQGLLAAGHNSALLVKERSSPSPSVRLQENLEPDHLASFNLVQKFCLRDRRTPLSNTLFSLGYPGFDLTAHPVIREADIINVHWVAGFQSPVTLARLQRLGKPVVWTFHDQRAFTGGCHYSAGCTGYEHLCAGCPQVLHESRPLPMANLADQLRLWLPQRITVVSPSHWLADCARRSATFRTARVEVIQYGIETDIFRPRPKAEVRHKLGLNPSTVYFLFGAGNCDEIRKGFDLFLEAVRRCHEAADFRQAVAEARVGFLCFGDTIRPAAARNLPIRFLGRFNSDEAVAELYSAVDIFLLPSIEDNLPNTLLESMCCGTPVVAHRVGGIPEVVTGQNTGWLVEPGATDMLAQAIRSLARDADERQRLGENCLREIPARFTLARQAEAYLRLFAELDSLRGKPAQDEPASPVGIGDERGMGPHFGALFDAFLREAKRARRVRRWHVLQRVRREVNRWRGIMTTRRR